MLVITMSETVDLSYPAKADANGTAKKYYRRRAYYFGRHSSPESFMLFGEWKRRLIETGEPPEVKTVRVDLKHSMERQERFRQYRVYLWPGATVLSSIVLAIAITAATSIFSTQTVPEVDGTPLSVEETLFVRGLRQHDASSRRASREQPGEVAEIYSRIMELGPNDGPLHESDLDF